jgi:hypothetical protein
VIGAFPAGAKPDLLTHRTLGTSELYLYNDGYVLPEGRPMLNGSESILVRSIMMYVAGYLDRRTVGLQLGAYETQRFAVDERTLPVATAFRPLNRLYRGGTTVRIRINTSGALWFGRGADGKGGVTRSSRNTSDVWNGGISGQIDYITAPSAPAVVRAEPVDKSSIRVAWDAPDAGGGTISGYRLQYSLSALFTDPIVRDVGNVTSHLLTGLQPGTTYFFRVAALNEVTTAEGSSSLWSRYAGRQTLPASAIRVWNGTAHAIADLLVHDGTTHVRPRSVKRWNGTSYVDPT